jgi:trimeric autotransporter adhesin
MRRWISVTGIAAIAALYACDGPNTPVEPNTKPLGVAVPLVSVNAEKGGPGGGTTAIDHGSLGGLLDDDHTQYLLAGGVRNSPNGFAVSGTIGAGSIPTSGPGTRLMWYPGKGAFRAGGVFVPGLDGLNLWDDSYIGRFSVAMGIDTRATGYAAVAFGVGSFAMGDRSVAFGSGNATGPESFAFGSGVASGQYAVAFGSTPSTRASGDKSMALGHGANTNGKTGAFVWADATPTVLTARADNQFVARAAQFWFGSNSNVTSTAGRLIETSTGAYLSSGGTWTNSSDSTRKTGFQDVDGESVLAKLAVMPIRTWQYRAEDSSVRHIGPTAQDFRAAYGLGDTEKAIATVDADGIALAAVQALEKRTREQAKTIAELQDARREIQDLRLALDALRAQMEQLATRGSSR